MRAWSWPHEHRAMLLSVLVGFEALGSMASTARGWCKQHLRFLMCVSLTCEEWVWLWRGRTGHSVFGALVSRVSRHPL